MSTRAIRRLQRLKEQEAQSSRSRNEEDASSEDDDIVQRATKPSPFAFLNAGNEGGEPDHDSDEITDGQSRQRIASPKPKKKRKKKKKTTQDEKDAEDSARQPATKKAGPDDVDLALLSLSEQKESHTVPLDVIQLEDAVTQLTCNALHIDPFHLQAANEMRKLFGRAAVSEARSEGANPMNVEAAGRRERRRAQQGGLGPGRRGQAGRGLATLGLRKNLFIQGKEDWPGGAGNGLGMELQYQDEIGVSYYRFVHNGAYRDAQRQFALAVESMDPQRLLSHLAHNPYHISTLLQVSEIARHERDHTASGVLLERALFSFGRALHSTFSSTVCQGKARLAFLAPENREFWLAGSRYIRNLGMRGTWRTAFEWTRLLLSLSPVEDPYYLAASLDRTALKCRQPQMLLDLLDAPQLADRWGNLPNMSFSRALALKQLQPDGVHALAALREAIAWFPWQIPPLFRALSITLVVPPSLSAAEPPNALQKLLCDSYALHAKELWGTPEATALLLEAVALLTKTDPLVLAPDTPIPRDLARHVLLSEDQTLIALLPRRFTTNPGFSADPLPPPDSFGPDIFSLSESGGFEGGTQGSRRDLFAEFVAQYYDPTGGQPGMDEEQVRAALEAHAAGGVEGEGGEAREASAHADEAGTGALAGLFRTIGRTLGLGASVESESELEDMSFDEDSEDDGDEEDEHGRQH